MKEQQKATKIILKILMWIFFGLIGLIVLGLIIAKVFETPEQKAMAEKLKIESDSLAIASAKVDSVKSAEKNQLRDAKYFSRNLLKKTMKDPDSYEEIEEKTYFVTDSKKVYIQTTIQYRARNSFGGMVVNKQVFSFDKKLNLIDVYEAD